MKGLWVAELVKGKIYHCLICGRPMLVVIHKRDPSTTGGYVAVGRYFNRVTGNYQVTDINDGQLTEITQKNE